MIAATRRRDGTMMLLTLCWWRAWRPPARLRRNARASSPPSTSATRMLRTGGMHPLSTCRRHQLRTIRFRCTAQPRTRVRRLDAVNDRRRSLTRSPIWLFGIALKRRWNPDGACRQHREAHGLPQVACTGSRQTHQRRLVTPFNGQTARCRSPRTRRAGQRVSLRTRSPIRPTEGGSHPVHGLHWEHGCRQQRAAWVVLHST